jgi:hypothetical protein
MENSTRLHWSVLIVLLAGAIMMSAWSSRTAYAASTIYYCPDRQGDQQYSAQPDPGCVPLVDKTPDVSKGTSQRHFQVDNLERDVSAFLVRYQKFLDCCKTDLTELREVEDMADELNQLLGSTQANLSNHSLASRGIMLRELLPRVAKARGDLKTLRARLEKINDLSGRRGQSDFETEGRQSQTIRELEESIERDFRAPTLPASAKTGTAIGVAPAAGPAIGRTPKTGTEIGQEGVTGREIGATPKNSRDIGASGPSGFEIGATGRAGPGIGESTLNEEASSSVGSTLQRSTIGSSLPDSTVGSSINSSTVGSTMPDTSVGSSSGGSSVGSSGSSVQGR